MTGSVEWSYKSVEEKLKLLYVVSIFSSLFREHSVGLANTLPQSFSVSACAHSCAWVCAYISLSVSVSVLKFKLLIRTFHIDRVGGNTY